MRQDFQQQQFQQQQRSQIKQDLSFVVDDVERVLRDLPENASDEVGALKQRATIQLSEVRNRLSEIEPLRAAGQRADAYVRQHPWAAIGGLSAAAFLVGIMSRGKH